MNSPTPEEHANAVKDALFAGNKIQAIKLYRAQVEISLADAKAAVEKLEAELRISAPERFAASQGKGCLAVVLAGVLIAGVAWLIS